MYAKIQLLFNAILLLAAMLPASLACQAEERVWTDASGNYKLQAEFVAGNDQSVVLQETGGKLLIVEIEQLSEADQQFLKERERRLREASADRNRSGDQLNDFELKDGTKIQGLIAEYGRRLVQIRRYQNRLYVNDRPFSGLPEFYQSLIPKIINHNEETKLKTERDILRWLGRQSGYRKAFTVEGVMLELSDGELVGVPFFMFNENDSKLLKPGWNDWLDASQDASYQAESSLRLRAEMIANRRAREQSLSMQRLELHLEAYDAGLFDMWCVAITPPSGQRALARQVIVPARNSAQASAEALRRYPGFKVVAAAKVNRRW